MLRGKGRIMKALGDKRFITADGKLTPGGENEDVEKGAVIRVYFHEWE